MLFIILSIFSFVIKSISVHGKLIEALVIIDPTNKHPINGRVAIFLKEGAFEGVRIQFVQEAIR